MVNVSKGSMRMCWRNVTHDRMMSNGPPAVVPASAAPDGTSRHKLSYWYVRRGPSDVLTNILQQTIITGTAVS